MVFSYDLVVRLTYGFVIPKRALWAYAAHLKVLGPDIVSIKDFEVELSVGAEAGDVLAPVYIGGPHILQDGDTVIKHTSWYDYVGIPSAQATGQGSSQHASSSPRSAVVSLDPGLHVT
jgi:hypothetical protein